MCSPGFTNSVGIGLDYGLNGLKLTSSIWSNFLLHLMLQTVTHDPFHEGVMSL